MSNTVLVIGLLTNMELRATALPVSLDITTLATQATLASIDTKTPSLGQAGIEQSIPVVLPATQLDSIRPYTNLKFQLHDVDNAGRTVFEGNRVLISLFISNSGSLLVFIHIYDSIESPLVGEVFLYCIPANSNHILMQLNFTFYNGISFRATTTYDGTSSPVANTVFINGTCI